MSKKLPKLINTGAKHGPRPTYDQLNESNALLVQENASLQSDLEYTKKALENEQRYVIQLRKEVGEGEENFRKSRAIFEELKNKMQSRIMDLKMAGFRWMGYITEWRDSQLAITSAELLPVPSSQEKFLLDNEKVVCRKRFHRLLTVPLIDSTYDHHPETDGNIHGFGECGISPNFGEFRPRFMPGDIINQPVSN